jgi:hypothetical protein
MDNESVEKRDDSAPSASRTLDNTTNEGATEEGVKMVGKQLWKTVCKAWHEGQRWFKTTKAMEISGLGVLVQTSSYDQGQVTESLVFIPKAELIEVEHGCVVVTGSE